MIFDEDNIFLIITYLLPGFIITKIVASELLLDNRSTANDIYKYLLYSVVNVILYSCIDFLYGFLLNMPYITNEQVVGFLRNLVTPIMFGFIFSKVMKKTRQSDIDISASIYRLFSALDLSRESQIDDAWDWVFYNLYLERENKPEIIVVLNDQTEIEGVFGEKSFASYSKAGNRCIFIEEEFGKSPDFSKSKRGRFISEKDIQSIQVYSRRIKPLKK